MGVPVLMPLRTSRGKRGGTLSVAARKRWAASEASARMALCPLWPIVSGVSPPVHTYFTAVRRHEDPDPPEPADTYLAVTRRRYVVRHYELSPPAYQLLQALLAGQSVGQAISRAVETAGPDLDRLADKLWRWFHDWAAEGFFGAVELAA
jgi:hypothetical protein